MRLIWTLTLALFVGLAAAPAQDEFGRAPGRGRFPGFNFGFTALDSNGDGVLDENEIAAAPQSLTRLDKNADGKITADEARPPMLEGRGRGGRGEPGSGAGATVVEDSVKTLMTFDANGDGKLSREELPERMQGVFDRGDENKDGILTPDEIRKMAAAQAAPASAMGRGGRDEGFRERNFIRVDPILAAVDADGDGAISSAEIANSAAAVRKMDKNGDGKITRDEVMPAAGRGRGF